jgi:heme exporter protein C
MSAGPVPHNAATSKRRVVGWVALGSGAAATLVGLTVAPPDAVQGNAARLIYLHVPAAWTAYLAYLVVLVASLQYLRTGGEKWDRYALIAGQIGVAMTALTIALGSVWGRAVWGVWWAWDPRLVSTAMMLVIYAGYLALRNVGVDRTARARRAAWLGVCGALTIPVVHFSVVWWRSLHQPATLLAPSIHPPIEPLMAAALALAVVAFTALAAWVFLWRDAALTSVSDTSAARPVASRR